MEQTRSEIENLEKLYDLYDTVIKSMSAFREKSWADTSKEDLNDILEEITKYGDQCVRLPSDLKTW